MAELRPQDFEKTLAGLKLWLQHVTEGRGGDSNAGENASPHVFIARSRILHFLSDSNQTHSVIKSFQDPKDPVTVTDQCPLTFCILVELERQELIDRFVKARTLWDDSLPHKTRPEDFPVVDDDPNFFERFRETQWKYCPAQLNSSESVKLDNERPLPILQKRRIGRGVTAFLYHITLHKDYDRLREYSGGGGHREFALKTYHIRNRNARTYYEKETQNFAELKWRRRARSPGLIDFYGGFEYKNTFNMLMEYADCGNLEEYFRREEPPSTGTDILEFFEAFHDVMKGVVNIHEIHLDRSDRKGSKVLQGRHQDIKPKNILVLGKQEESPYQRRFKLADLGISHFERHTPDDVDVVSTDTRGTRTYGAPEIHRATEYDESLDLPASQSVDIWSLGCVLIEICVWIVRGMKYLNAFRESRSQENDRSPPSANDCFHDGQYPDAKVLRTVRQQISQLEYETRYSDFITPSILRLAEDMIQINPKERLTAYIAMKKCENYIREAKERLDEYNQLRILHCDATMVLRPSLASQTSDHLPSPIGDSFEGPGETHPHGPNRGAQPDTPITSRNVYTSPQTTGVYDSPVPRRLLAERNRAMSTPSNRPIIRYGVTGHPPYHIPSGHMTSPTIDAIALPKEFGSNQPSAVERLPASNPVPPVAIATSFRSEVPQDVPDVPLHESPSSEDWPIVATGSAPSSPANVPFSLATEDPQSSSASKAGGKRSSSSSKSTQSYLSLNDAIKHIINSSSLWGRLRTPKLKDGHHKDSFKKRDHMFLIDDSVTMRDFAERVYHVFFALAHFAVDADPNGVDIKFMNSGDTSTLTRHPDVKPLSEAVKSRVGSATSITEPKIKLSAILSPYVAKVKDQPKPGPLPLSIYVLTDGRWSKAEDAENLVLGIAQDVKRLGKRRNQIGLQFVNFGTDRAGRATLQKLDDIGKQVNMDICDTTDSDGNIWKMLLGAIDPLFDEDD